MLEEDTNKRYFHSVANGGYRKKLIHSLTHDEGTIEGHEQLKSYITNYYKGLSGDPLESNLSMDESRIDDIPHVPQEEITLLTAPTLRMRLRRLFSKWNIIRPRVWMVF
jgi:hypothetical protein